MQGVRDKIGLYLGLFVPEDGTFFSCETLAVAPGEQRSAGRYRAGGFRKKSSAIMFQLAMPNCRETGGFGRNHSLSFDHRLRPDTLRTAMATAFLCPTSTTSFLPRVTPV